MTTPELIAEPGTQPQGLAACRELLQRGDCRSVRYYAQIGSTNSAAQQDISIDRPPPADQLPRLYLADQQTQGRGRLGRQWLSDDGSLTFSLLSPLDADRAGWLPLVIGLAIAHTIEYFAAPVHARIKWPNDVYVAGGKVAGVLVEAVGNRPGYVIVGVGLNVATQMNNVTESIGKPARSLNELARGPRHRYQWLPELVSQMNQAIEQLVDPSSGPQPWLAEIRRRCLLTGSQVRYRWGDRLIQGRCLGIDDDGGLKVHDGSTVQRLRSGEVTLHQ